MAILDSELKMFKSKEVSDGFTNGGLMDNLAQVTSGVVNNVWPSVFKAERTNGSTKYRKTFFKVANDNDETLFNPQLWLDNVTPADDWVTFFPGTQTDIQGDISTPEQYGCASLKTNVPAGGGSVVVTVEDASLASEIFRDGDTIRITNKDTPNSGTGTEEIHVINEAPSVTDDEVTITLTATLANAYNIDDNAYGTRVMSVYEPMNAAASVNSFSTTTAGTGTYDSTSYPVILDNLGTIAQDITITFTGSTTFTATSNVSGVTLPGGDTSADYSPSNPDTGKPYFTLSADGFMDVWASGDTLTFNTVPAAVPIWQKRVVPAGASSLAGNKTSVVFTGESV